MEIESNLAKSGPFFLGKFSHIDINLMCCFHRLTDVKLDKLLDLDELPNLSKYWKLLKGRDSYKIGVLNFLAKKSILIPSSLYAFSFRKESSDSPS